MTTLTPANFSHDALRATVATDAIAHRVDKPTVVVNLAPRPALINEDLGGYIPAINSTILTGGATVTGDMLALIDVPERGLDEAHFRRLGWEDFYSSTAPDAKPGTSVLLKSPQQIVGQVRLAPSQVLADGGAPDEPADYEVRVNLWFSPAGTDCGIHRVHRFIETHTQVMGIGRMQKFRDNVHETIYEDQSLAPGQTQPSLFGRWHDGGFAYPWHQYYAQTDTVWLAVEYHAM